MYGGINAVELGERAARGACCDQSPGPSYMSGRKGATNNGDVIGLSLSWENQENGVTEAKEEYVSPRRMWTSVRCCR